MKFCNKNKKQSLVIVGNITMLTLELNMEISEKNDYKVYSYGNGEEAIQELKMLQPEIVILDSYPGKGMNDQQTVITIKSLLPNVYVIILSDANDVDAAIDLLKSGADSFIYKSENTLSEVLEEVNSLAKINNQYSI